MLTQERLKELLDYDPLTGIFSWRTSRGSVGAGRLANSINKDGYVSIMVEGRNYPAHRLAWLYIYGVWPNEDIDHKNRHRQSNSISNLRVASRSENLQNSGLRSDNNSGCKGVHWDSRRRKWKSEIRVGGKFFSLGRFATLFDAVCARKAAEIQYHPYRAA